MFALIVIAEVHAATAAPAPTVDNQALMMIIMGIVGGIVAGLGSVFYKKSPTTPPAPDPPQRSIEEAKVFFQGPFQAILDRLNTAVLTLERIVGQNADLREHFGELLRTTRHDLKGVLQVMSQEQEHDSEELMRLLHDLSNVVGRLDEFLRARIK